MYCNTIWCNTLPTYLDPLIKCQKRAVRVISGAKKYDHTMPLFKNHQILNLRKIYVYSVQNFLYKYIHNKLPSIFANFFTLVADVHGHNTRQGTLFRVPMAKCPQMASALRCSGSKTFNNFTNSINYNCEYATFKYKVRKTLLDLPHDAVLV